MWIFKMLRRFLRSRNPKLEIFSSSKFLFKLLMPYIVILTVKKRIKHFSGDILKLQCTQVFHIYPVLIAFINCSRLMYWSYCTDINNKSAITFSDFKLVARYLSGHICRLKVIMKSQIPIKTVLLAAGAWKKRELA